MKLIPQSSHLEDYLTEIPPIVMFDTPLIQSKIKKIKAEATLSKERAELAFKIARDEIHHSFDKKEAEEVTIYAEDILEKKKGICFAKSHLLATLLRGMGIPTGFCYQRALRDGKTVESGYALHGLNAIWLDEYGWFRVDPRGNKPGIDSEFTIEKEQLAYPIRPELGEVDYPNIFTRPLDSVIHSMKDSKDSKELFFKRPETL